MGIEPLWTLAGVVVGGGLTTGIEMLKNRLSHRAQDCQLAISRAEDAVEICQSLMSWIGQILDIAKTGKLINDDPPRIYRLAAIAQGWVPELLPHLDELHKSLYELMNEANFKIAVPIRNHVLGGRAPKIWKLLARQPMTLRSRRLGLPKQRLRPSKGFVGTSGSSKLPKPEQRKLDKMPKVVMTGVCVGDSELAYRNPYRAEG